MGIRKTKLLCSSCVIKLTLTVQDVSILVDTLNDLHQFEVESESGYIFSCG